MSTVDIEIEEDIDSKPEVKEKKKKPVKLILILLIIITIVGAVVKFDVFGVKTQYIYPALSKVPIVKNIIPKEEMVETDETQEIINQEIEGFETTIEALEQENNQLKQEIENLKVFESEYLEFKEEKRLFDEQVASMNKEDFIKYYEKMHPENANNIYNELNIDQEIVKKQKKYANMISEIDEDKAAKLLENLFDTDMDVILLIFNNMDMERAAAILGEMDSKKAAVIVKQLAPE